MASSRGARGLAKKMGTIMRPNSQNGRWRHPQHRAAGMGWGQGLHPPRPSSSTSMAGRIFESPSHAPPWEGWPRARHDPATRFNPRRRRSNTSWAILPGCLHFSSLVEGTRISSSLHTGPRNIRAAVARWAPTDPPPPPCPSALAAPSPNGGRIASAQWRTGGHVHAWVVHCHHKTHGVASS